MIMDLASALLSPQNRRLFKFHNLANPEQELLLETFKGTVQLSGFVSSRSAADKAVAARAKLAA